MKPSQGRVEHEDSALDIVDVPDSSEFHSCSINICVQSSIAFIYVIINLIDSVLNIKSDMIEQINYLKALLPTRLKIRLFVELLQTIIVIRSSVKFVSSNDECQGKK